VIRIMVWLLNSVSSNSTVGKKYVLFERGSSATMTQKNRVGERQATKNLQNENEYHFY
jgi:hypothetical protein